MSKEKVGFDRYCGYRIPVEEKSDVVHTHDVICRKDSKPCRIPCPYDGSYGTKGLKVCSDSEEDERTLSLPTATGDPRFIKEVQARIRRLIDQWGPSFLETLIEGIDQNPEFYEWLCETFATKYPERAKKFFSAGELAAEIASSLDDELKAEAAKLCDEVHNAEPEPCLTDVRAYSCVLNALAKRGLVTEEVQTTTLRFEKKAPAATDSTEKEIVPPTESDWKTCATCGSEYAKCPECERIFLPDEPDAAEVTKRMLDR